MNRERKHQAETKARHTGNLSPAISRRRAGFLGWVREHLFSFTLISYVLQIAGTVELSLFSFYGIEILQSNPDAYFENTPKVTINPTWFFISKIALVVLIVGLLLSAFTSLVAVPSRQIGQEH